MTAQAMLVLVALVAAGCEFTGGGGGEDWSTPQTIILDVRVEPDTVAVGDTALFTSVIRDSLDERFRFTWFLDAPPVTTEEAWIEWVADTTAGTYFFGVTADNGDLDRPSVSQQFRVVVTR